jgi:hypothetical protein
MKRQEPSRCAADPKKMKLCCRKNIAEMGASSISLMPEDLEKSLSRQDIADVITYLQGGF